MHVSRCWTVSRRKFDIAMSPHTNSMCLIETDVIAFIRHLQWCQTALEMVWSSNLVDVFFKNTLLSLQVIITLIFLASHTRLNCKVLYISKMFNGHYLQLVKLTTTKYYSFMNLWYFCVNSFTLFVTSASPNSRPRINESGVK